jgi:hypothetical protein
MGAEPLNREMVSYASVVAAFLLGTAIAVVGGVIADDTVEFAKLAGPGC